MTQPDRTHGPAGKPVDHLWFQHVEPIITERGQPLWYFPTKDIGVARCYIVHPGGYSQAERSLPLRAAAQLMLSGSLHHTAEEIHESLERIGASADVHADNRYAQVTVSARSSYLSEALELFLVHSAAAVYPDNEISVYRSAASSDLLSRMATPRYWSYRKLMEQIAGETHYLGRFTNVSDFDHLNPSLLKQNAEQSFYPDDTYLIVCGDLSDVEFNSLLSVWNKYAATFKEPGNKRNWQYTSLPAQQVEHVVPNANQVSLYWGQRNIQIPESHYFDFMVLNTLLGGFFGSRLMQNIREKKGLTYGIHSSLLNQGEEYHWYISGEVKSENKTLVIDEVASEMRQLQTQTIEAHELEKVKQYLCGNLKMGFDGVFSMAARLRELKLNNRDYGFIDGAIPAIRAVTADRLQHIANTFLNPDAFYISAAGAV